MSLKARITLYSLILFFGLSNVICGAIDGGSAYDSFSPYMRYFGPIAAFFGLLTMIWASVLLAFNNRPTSTHVLTRASVHSASMATLVVIWLALAVMAATQIPKECDFITPSDGLAYVWCSLAASIFGIAAILAILSLSACILIFVACRQTGLTSSGNISDLDGTRWKHAIKLAEVH